MKKIYFKGIKITIQLLRSVVYRHEKLYHRALRKGKLYNTYILYDKFDYRSKFIEDHISKIVFLFMRRFSQVLLADIYLRSLLLLAVQQDPRAPAFLSFQTLGTTSSPPSDAVVPHSSGTGSALHWSHFVPSSAQLETQIVRSSSSSCDAHQWILFICIIINKI